MERILVFGFAGLIGGLGVYIFKTQRDINEIKEDLEILGGTLEGLIDGLYQERVDDMFHFLTQEIEDD